MHSGDKNGFYNESTISGIIVVNLFSMIEIETNDKSDDLVQITGWAQLS